MGVRLICEVLDTAPPDLGPSERLVLVIIAEDANDATRRGWPDPELLTKRSGLSADGIQKVLRRLSDRGIELRVALGKDKRGHPVYAVPGKQRTFEIPNLRLVSPDPRPGRADNRPTSRADNRPARPDERAEQPGRASAPSPHDPLTPQRSSSRRRTDEAPKRDDVEQLCEHLADRIEGNGSKRPPITKAWRTEARLLIDKDGRTVDQITRCIDWCQADSFWRKNILSMPKLREKYDQLRLNAQDGRRGRPTTADKVAKAVAAGDRLQEVLDQKELEA